MKTFGDFDNADDFLRPAPVPAPAQNDQQNLVHQQCIPHNQIVAMVEAEIMLYRNELQLNRIFRLPNGK